VVAASIPGGVATALTTKVDMRQEGREGAQFHLRRDADGGGSEKGRIGDGSAFYRRGGGVEEGGMGGGHVVGRGWGRRGGPAPRSGGRHRPGADAHGRWHAIVRTTGEAGG
jgi:hypothetical protein